MVVIKLLNAGREWPGLPERFEREQTAMAALAHPNIVPVLGHGWSETGMPYIVTGEVSGGSIGDRLRGPTPMTGPDILSLGVRLAGALESAHRAGVVHGDLRPDDMMLSPQGEPLLADFGVVTLVRPNAGDVTDPAELAHVAPELLDGNPASPSSDLYSLTSALYTLFAGIPAYVRPGEQSIIPVIKRIASDPLPDLTAKNVPAPVVDAITKGMAKSPAERHQSAQDLGRSLQQAQVALGLPMTEMTMLGSASARTAPVQPTAPVAMAATTDVARSSSGRGGPDAGPGGPPPAGGGAAPNRTPLIIGIVVAVAVIAAIAFFATRDSGGSKVGDEHDDDHHHTSPLDDHDGRHDPFDRRWHRARSRTTVASSRSPCRRRGRSATPTRPPTASPSSWRRPTSPSFSRRPSPSQESTSSPSRRPPSIRRISTRRSTRSSTSTAAARTSGRCAPAATAPTSRRAASGSTRGRQEVLTGCGGGGDVIIMAATNADLTFTALLEVHVGNPPDQGGRRRGREFVQRGAVPMTGVNR